MPIIHSGRKAVILVVTSAQVNITIDPAPETSFRTETITLPANVAEYFDGNKINTISVASGDESSVTVIASDYILVGERS